MSENKLNNKQFALIAIIIIICGIAIVGHDYFLAKKSKAYEDMSIILSQEPEEAEQVPEEPQTSIVTRTDNSINDTSGKVKKPNRTYNYIGRLKIPEINLNRGFVKYGTSDNNVHYNIAIMKGSQYPDVAGGNFILAAHSGSGWNAFFTNIDKLKIGSTARVIYDGKKYDYQLTKIYKDPKSDGTVTIKGSNNNNKRLILVTCKRPDYKRYYLVLVFEFIGEKDL